MNEFMRIESFQVQYEKDQPKIIEDLNLSINECEAIGLIGKNGCGKSTLALALVGIIPFYTPGIVKGSAVLNNVNLLELNLDSRLKHINYSFQDAESQVLFGDVSVVLGLKEKDTDEDLIYSAINYLGVNHLLKRRPNELSSGEAQKIALITPLRLSPSLIIYDEAISALDPIARVKFKKLLRKITQTRGKSLILIGQRIELLQDLCDDIKVMQNGKLLKSDQAGKISNEKHPNESELFHLFNLLKNEICKNQSPISLVIRNVEASYKRGDFSLGPINLEIKPGEIIAFLGENGSGKTSLFSAINKSLRTRRGDIEYGNNNAKYNILTVNQSPPENIISVSIEEELQSLIPHSLLENETFIDIIKKVFNF